MMIMRQYTKTASITKEQYEWIEINCLNFSKWVRLKISEEIIRDIERKEKSLRESGMMTSGIIKSPPE